MSSHPRRCSTWGTLLFVDEIHRFNRAQQDSFLPYVEDGTIVLVRAITENPSFELNAALLSRCQVLVLKRLDDAALATLITRAEELLGTTLPLDDARQALIAMADGDSRYLLNMIEQVQSLPGPRARSTSHAYSSASQARTSASPTRKQCSRPAQHGTSTNASAHPKASSPSPKPSSTSPQHPSRSRYTAASTQGRHRQRRAAAVPHRGRDMKAVGHLARRRPGRPGRRRSRGAISRAKWAVVRIR
jgi:hypothetical protein